MCKGAFRHCVIGLAIKFIFRTKSMVEHRCTGLRRKRHAFTPYYCDSLCLLDAFVSKYQAKHRDKQLIVDTILFLLLILFFCHHIFSSLNNCSFFLAVSILCCWFCSIWLFISPLFSVFFSRRMKLCSCIYLNKLVEFIKLNVHVTWDGGCWSASWLEEKFIKSF